MNHAQSLHAHAIVGEQGTSGRGPESPVLLCIDDDPEVSLLIEWSLRDFDVRVLRSFHGMQGFAAAVRHLPSAIVMDVGMPGGDGVTVLECLKRDRETARIPVVLLSGMRDPGLPRKMFELGADQFLHKPVHRDALRRELGRFIVLRNSQ